MSKPMTTSAIKTKANQFNALPFPEKIGLAIIVQLAIIPPLMMAGGADWLTAYREATITGQYGIDTWNPYAAYWLFAPFAALPPQLSWLLWNLFGAVGIVYAIKTLNGRLLPFALSLPCLWLFYSGQIEGVVALGLALGLAASPLVAGVGILLLSLKPQLGIIPILFILFHRRDYRLLLLPAIAYAASLLQWGWWLPEWVESITSNNVTTYATNTSLWPYSLVLLPLLWLKRDSLQVWLLVQALVMPYFAIYSLALLFVLELPTWANVMTWALCLVGIFFTGAIAWWLVPVAMLGPVVVGEVVEKVHIPIYVLDTIKK